VRPVWTASTKNFGGRMTVEHDSISWQSDFDQALEDAKQQQSAVLLDFSAAPI
jgi:hypothetical protein